MIGVTFNIKYDEGYSDRYAKLRQALLRFKIVEERTTSCVFLDTDDAKAVDLALYGALDYKKDKAITFPAYKHTLIYFGPS